jgi:hypothetical protein
MITGAAGSEGSAGMTELDQILPYPQASEVFFAVSLLVAWLNGLVVILVSGWRQWRTCQRRRALFRR